MTHSIVRWLLVGCAGLLFACDDEDESRCRIARTVEFVETPLTTRPDAELVTTNAGLLLVALDGDIVRWAPLGRDGTLGAEQSFPLPTRGAGPWFAVTGKGGAGNQLVAVYTAPSATDAQRSEVIAIAQGAPGQATAPVVLHTTEAGANAGQLRVAVGSSRTGTRAAVAIGYAEQPLAPVTLTLLGPDAQPIGPATPLTEVPAVWRCLSFFPSIRSDIGVFLLDPTVGGNKPDARIYEVNDAGANPFIGKPSLGEYQADAQCPTVAPSPTGYLVAWWSASGASVADYNISARSVLTEFLGGEIAFGGPVPPIAAVASMVPGRTAVAFAASRGPEVRLYDFQGILVGKPTLLPATLGQQVGKVAGTSDLDALFLTYREGVTLASGGGPRRFLRVECPR